MIAFPNVLQHQVQPFELADPTRPGTRKILVLFLVDPGLRVTSTSTVPPQQLHWLRSHAADSHLHRALRESTSLIPDLASISAEYLHGRPSFILHAWRALALRAILLSLML
jgi:hypothetical protein